jgi:glutathione reductase (NADPH)
MTFDVDLFVIGGGSGGVRAARVAAETGARVMLAEEDRMGGTCVIRGCVPKKLMVFASGYAQAAREAADYGWQIQMGGLDWGRFQARLTGELDRLEGIYTANLKKAGVVIVHERASVADPHTVELASGRRVATKHILVATGGRPFKPAETPGIEHAIVSDDVFHLSDLPKRLLIVGGGYIASEFACIFHGMGSHVTQLYRGAQILRGFDDECRGHLAELIQGRGIDLRLGTDVQWIERHDDGLRVKASDGTEAEFDQVLYATGRKPNSGGMGLAEAGVKLGRWGQVEVDRFSQSSVPSIYAIGDVTDRVNLTPVAIREGAAFVETVFRGIPTPVDHDCIPSAVFTQPEYGAVGLTEERAREQEEIEVYCAAFRPMQGAFIGSEERVLFKLIVSRANRRVLGCHIIAPGAGEMIQLAGIAVKLGATKEDFDRTVAVHPTMAEEIVLMKTPVRTA